MDFLKYCLVEEVERVEHSFHSSLCPSSLAAWTAKTAGYQVPESGWKNTDEKHNERKSIACYS